MWKEEEDMFVLMRDQAPHDTRYRYLASPSSCVTGGWVWTHSIDQARKFHSMHELLYFIAQSAQTYDGLSALQGEQLTVARVKKEMKVLYNMTPL